MRKRLLMFLVTICAVLTLMLIVTVSSGEWWQVPLNPLTTLLMVSFFATFSVWICSRLNGVHTFLFIFNGLFDDLAVYLAGLHSLLQLAALLIVWGCFANWWLQWKPKKYRSNFALLSSEQSRQYLSARQAKIISGRARSWMGSRLIGMPDGLSVVIKRWLFVLGLMAVLLVPGIYLFDRKAPHELTAYLLVIALLIVAFLAAQTIATNLFNNLRYLWLCSPGNRESFFVLMFKRYCTELAPFILLSMLGAVFIEIYFGEYGEKNWPVLFGFIFLLFGTVFYFSWMVYQLSAYKLAWYVISALVLPPVWLLAICATGLVFPLPFGWQPIPPVWIISIQLIAIIAMHWQVRKGMGRLNFARVV